MITVPKGTSVEELLEALRVVEVLGQEKTDLAEKEVARQANLSPKEKLVQKLSADLAVVRRKKKPKRLSWQKKRANRRAIQRKYQEGRRERVNKEWALKLIEGKPEDLYFWVSKKRGDARYKYQRPEWKISYEEFLEYVYPTLGDRVPLVRRYDAKRPWTLGNTVWLDSENVKSILFDGKEHSLRKGGYIL